MRALILSGGLGTRLRPLTLTTPKPLLPIFHRPFLSYQLELLRQHAVRDVALASAYRAPLFRKHFADGSRFRMRISYFQEKKPLGTGGAVKHAQSFFREPTFVLNGDILTTVNLTALYRFHCAQRSMVTIALVRVKDPTRFGLIETTHEGKILRFVEKPSWEEVTSNTINAGIYLFDPKVLDCIPRRVSYSLERGLFPYLLEKGMPFYGYVCSDYWLDIGTGAQYLQVHRDLLERFPAVCTKGMKRRRVKRITTFLAPGAIVAKHLQGEGHLVLGERSRVESYVQIEGFAAVGKRCTIKRGAFLRDVVLLDGVTVGEGARIEGCIIGERSLIEAETRLGSGQMLGPRSRITRFSRLAAG